MTCTHMHASAEAFHLAMTLIKSLNSLVTGLAHTSHLSFLFKKWVIFDGVKMGEH